MRRKGMIKKRCMCRGENFFVEPNEQWRTICKKCYKEYYLPLKNKYKLKDIENLWGWILEKHHGITRDGHFVRSSKLPGFEDPWDNGVEVYWTGLDFDYR